MSSRPVRTASAARTYLRHPNWFVQCELADEKTYKVVDARARKGIMQVQVEEGRSGWQEPTRVWASMKNPLLSAPTPPAFIEDTDEWD